MEVQQVKSIDPADPDSTYQYKPLEPGTIRLLSIEWRDQDDIAADGVVLCSIQHVSLNTFPKYTALSYVWGPPEPGRYIFLNGYKTKVTGNLGLALHMFNNILASRNEGLASRNEGLAVKDGDLVSLPLWVDALCINQGDKKEKSEQVQKMRLIYENALCVYAWLGQATWEMLDLMMQLSDLSARHGHHTREEWEFDNYPELEVDLRSRFENGSIQQQWVEALYNKPYWNRVWILQELAVSQDVLLITTHGMVPWSPFLRAYFSLITYEPENTMPNVRKKKVNPQSMVITALRYQTSNLDRPTLVTLLSYTRGSLKATDDRDLVFALLGLAGDADELGIVPDYEKSLRTIYTELALALLRKYHVHFLIDVEMSVSEPHLGLSSWVPDWRRKNPESIDCGPPHFSATGAASNLKYARETDDGTCSYIAIFGALVDSVSVFGKSWDENYPGCELRTATTWFGDFEAIIREHRIKYNECEKAEAIMSSAIALHREDPKYHEYVKSYQHLRNTEHNLIDTEDERAGHLRGSYAYLHRMYYKADRRRLFISADGYIGLGPAAMKPNDLIVIFYDSMVPFILRQERPDKHEFLVVGPAYVHGIMYGELLETEARAEEHRAQGRSAWFYLL